MNHINSSRNMSQTVSVAFVVMLSIRPTLCAVELPEELPLWEKVPGDYAIAQDIKEQVRSYKARPGPKSLNPAVSINGRLLSPETEHQVILPPGTVEAQVSFRK